MLSYIKDFYSFKMFESEDISDLQDKWNFHSIPDENNNYRSSQMPLHILPKILKKNQIKAIIRLNWNGNDGRHYDNQDPVDIEDEKKLAESNGVDFHKLSSDDPEDQNAINQFLKGGNCLVHCAHGADRTGGAVGGYLKTVKPNKNLLTTGQIWDYTTKYNNWNSILNEDPKNFKEDYYLGQAKKFGVKDLDHAIKLAKKYK